MKKNLLVGIVAIFLVMAVVLTYLFLRFGTANMPYIPGMTRPIDTGSIVEHATYYDIAAKYATTTPLLAIAGRAADEAAVKLMKKFVDDIIVNFKANENFANLTLEDIKMMGFADGRKQTLTISNLTASSPHTVSYIFNIYKDTFGAHGNTYYRTFTFDRQSGESLTLADIFVKDATYLDTLSSISRAKLPDIIDKDMVDAGMIADGTTPEHKSFENFFLDGTSLVIIFPPYAVAPYAAGSQTLAVPLSSLKTILEPRYM